MGVASVSHRRRAAATGGASAGCVVGSEAGGFQDPPCRTRKAQRTEVRRPIASQRTGPPKCRGVCPGMAGTRNFDARQSPPRKK